MTKGEALKKLQAIKAYMTSGNPIWSVEPIGEAFDMAIEALTAKESCVLNQFGECSYSETGCSDCEIKEKIRKALEQSQWIPISDREPDTAAHVLVTAKWSEDDYEVFETDYWVVKHGANDPNWLYQAVCKKEIDHITAWQRMPEPYKGGE